MDSLNNNKFINKNFTGFTNDELYFDYEYMSTAGKMYDFFTKNDIWYRIVSFEHLKNFDISYNMKQLTGDIDDDLDALNTICTRFENFIQVNQKGCKSVVHESDFARVLVLLQKKFRKFTIYHADFVIKTIDTKFYFQKHHNVIDFDTFRSECPTEVVVEYSTSIVTEPPPLYEAIITKESQYPTETSVYYSTPTIIEPAPLYEAIITEEEITPVETPLSVIMPIYKHYSAFIHDFKGHNIAQPDNISFSDFDIMTSHIPVAHCISSDRAQFRGFAASLRNKYFSKVPENEPDKRLIGTVEFQKNTHDDRLILNLITKECYFHKPTYANVYKVIYNLRTFVCQNNIQNLCMPMIGCGLDGLKKDQVKNIIFYLLQDVNCNFIISEYKEEYANKARRIFAPFKKIENTLPTSADFPKIGEKPIIKESINYSKLQFNNITSDVTDEVETVKKLPFLSFTQQYLNKRVKYMDFSNKFCPCSPKEGFVYRTPCCRTLTWVAHRNNIKKICLNGRCGSFMRNIHETIAKKITPCVKGVVPIFKDEQEFVDKWTSYTQQIMDKQCVRPFKTPFIKHLVNIFAINLNNRQSTSKVYHEPTQFTTPIVKCPCSHNNSLNVSECLHFVPPSMIEIMAYTNHKQQHDEQPPKIIKKKCHEKVHKPPKVPGYLRALRFQSAVQMARNFAKENFIAERVQEIDSDFKELPVDEKEEILDDVIDEMKLIKSKVLKQSLKSRKHQLKSVDASSTCLNMLTELQTIFESIPEDVKTRNVISEDKTWQIDSEGNFIYKGDKIANVDSKDFSTKFWKFIKNDFKLVKQQDNNVISSIITKQVQDIVDKYISEHKYLIASTLTDFILSLISSVLGLNSALRNNESHMVKIVHVLALIGKAFHVVSILISLNKVKSHLESISEFQTVLQDSVVYWSSKFIPEGIRENLKALLNIDEISLCPSKEVIDKFRYEQPHKIKRFLCESRFTKLTLPDTNTYIHRQQARDEYLKDAFEYSSQLRKAREILNEDYRVSFTSENIDRIKSLMKNCQLLKPNDVLLLMHYYEQVFNQVDVAEDTIRTMSFEVQGEHANTLRKLYTSYKTILSNIVPYNLTAEMEFMKAVIYSRLEVLSRFVGVSESYLRKDFPHQLYLIENHVVIDSLLEVEAHIRDYFVPEQQGITDLSFATMLSICTGLAAVSISIYDVYKGNNPNSGLGSRIIIGNRTVAALKDNVKQMQSLVEEVSYDVFGYVLSTKHFVRLQGEVYINKLRTEIETSDEEYVSNQTRYFELQTLIEQAEKFQHKITINNHELSVGDQAILRSLSTCIVQAQEKHNTVFETFKRISIRQMPTWYHFYGREGAGKTEFINRYIIPTISQDLNTTTGVYALNLDDDGNSFFPRYLGQDIAFTDEFWKSQAADKLNGKLTNIINTTPYVMEGAGLRDKNQMCAFKLFLTASNFATIDLNGQINTNWTTTWLNPLLDRQHHVHVLNKTQFTANSEWKGIERDHVQHSETFDELMFVEYKMPSHNSNYDAARLRDELISHIPQPRKNAENKLVSYTYVPEENRFEEDQDFLNEVQPGKWYKMVHQLNVFYKLLTPAMIVEKIRLSITKCREDFLSSCKRTCIASFKQGEDKETFTKKMKLQGMPETIINEVWDEKQEPPASQQALYNSTQQVICHVLGESGVGKTELLKEVSNDLGQIKNMPVLKASTLEDVKNINAPCILQVDDKIAIDDGQFIMDLQEYVPPTSIILYSSNLRVITEKLTNHIFGKSRENALEVQPALRLLPFLAGFKQAHLTANVPYMYKKGKRIWCSDMNEGWYRRIGFPGVTIDRDTMMHAQGAFNKVLYKIIFSLIVFLVFGLMSLSFEGYYMNFLLPFLSLLCMYLVPTLFVNEFYNNYDNFIHTPYVTPQWNLTYVMESRNLVREISSKQIQEKNNIIKSIEYAHLLLMDHTLNIKIVETTEKFLPPECDVNIFVKTAKDLPKLLNNPPALLAVVGRQGVPSVSLSKRVFTGEFTTCLQDWHIPEQFDIVEIEKQVKRTYSLLLEMNSSFTVRIICNDLIFHGSNNVVKYWRASEKSYVWNISETTVEETHVVKFENDLYSFAIDYDTVLDVLQCNNKFLYKFGLEKDSKLIPWWETGEIPNDVLSSKEKLLIMTHANEISKLPNYPRNVTIQRNERVSMQEVSNTIRKTVSSFSTYKTTVTFTAVTCLLGLAISGGAIWFTYNQFKKREEFKQTDAQKLSSILDLNKNIPFTVIRNDALCSGYLTASIRVIGQISVIATIEKLKGFAKSYITENHFKDNVKQQLLSFLVMRCDVKQSVLDTFKINVNGMLDDLAIIEYIPDQQKYILQNPKYDLNTVKIDCTMPFIYELPDDKYRMYMNATLKFGDSEYNEESVEYPWDGKTPISWILPFTISVDFNNDPNEKPHVLVEFLRTEGDPCSKHWIYIEDQYKRVLENVVKLTFTDFKQRMVRNITHAINTAMVFEDSNGIETLQQSDVGHKGKKTGKHVRAVITRMSLQDIIAEPTPSRQNLCNSTPINRTFHQNAISTLQAIRDNQVKVFGIDIGTASYGLGIKNDILICNLHVISKSQDIQIENCEGPEKLRKYFKGVVIHKDPINDIAVIRKLTGEYFRDITNKFLPRQYYDHLNAPGFFLRHSKENWIIQTALRHDARYDSGVKFDTGEDKFSIHEGQVVVSEFIETSFATQPGDCGSPYLAEVKGDLCVCAIHTLGIGAVSKSFGSLLTKEAIEYYLSKVIVPTQEGFKNEICQSLKNIPTLVQVPQERVVEECNIDVLMPEEWDEVINFKCELPEREYALFRPNEFNYGVAEHSNTALIGYTNRCSKSTFMKSKHIPSLFAEELTLTFNLENPKDNAVFDPRRVEDPTDLIKDVKTNSPSIIFTQCSFYNDEIPDGHDLRHAIRKAERDLYLMYDEWYPKTQTRLMSEMEQINGFYLTLDDLHGTVDSINLDTSPGAFFMQFYGQQDKRGIFEIDLDVTIRTGPASQGRMLYRLNSTPLGRRVADDIRLKQSLAQMQMWLAHPCKGSLKDETLKLEKVKKGKTRLFEAADIRDVLWHRKFLGGLAGSMKLNRTKASAQIGINADVEFHRIYQDFLIVANKGEAGDFKNFDKHISRLIIRSFISVARKLVERSMDEKTRKFYSSIWEIIFLDLSSSFSFVDGFLLQYSRGNRSGAFTTTVLNSYANDIMHIVVMTDLLNRIPPSIKEEFNITTTARYIFSNIPIKTLGDDIVKVISPHLQPYINFQVVSDAYKELFGMTYTSPSKEADTETLHVSLNDMSFLSREFKYQRDYDLVLAPLKRSTLLGMLFWSTGNSPDLIEAALLNARKEFQLIPPEDYEQYRTYFNFCVDIARRRFNNISVDKLEEYDVNILDVCERIRL